MLKVLNPVQQNLLHLADRLENLRPGEFNMAYWQSCIRGHAEQMGFTPEEIGCPRDSDAYTSLFIPGLYVLANEAHLSQLRKVIQNARHAASVVRHFALTGEIDWGWGVMARVEFPPAVEPRPRSFLDRIVPGLFRSRKEHETC